MRRLFHSPTLVLILFIGITAGNGLPYAQLYQIKAAKTFSCHCCDHGKVNCPHCAKHGHRGERSLSSSKKQAVAKTVQAVPCSTSRQHPQNLNFSTEPFVMVPVQLIEFRPQMLRVIDLDERVSVPAKAPPTPPPQFIA